MCFASGRVEVEEDEVRTREREREREKESEGGVKDSEVKSYKKTDPRKCRRGSCGVQSGLSLSLIVKTAK
jgi:hypothetical protein